MLNILYEDNEIIVCVKEAGISSQAERSLSPDMPSLLMNYLKNIDHNSTKNVNNSTSKAPYVGVIHRLDKPVCGIMVYGKTKAATASLTKQLQAHEFSKSYKAVICSKKPLNICDSYEVLRDFLIRDGKTNTSSVCKEDTVDGKEAVLEYRAEKCVPFTELSTHGQLKRFAPGLDESIQYLSTVDIHLITGRHHQIRVQFAPRDMFLWGDTRYGSQNFRQTTVALCAYKLSFTHPTTKKELCFSITPDNSIFKYM